MVTITRIPVNEIATTQDFKNWLLYLIVLLFILYEIAQRIWPAIKKAYNAARYGTDIVAKVEKHEQELYGEDGVNEKLSRDKLHLSRLDEDVANLKKSGQSASEENELIMKALLAIIQGMSKLGDGNEMDGIQKEITEFINKQAHREQ